MMSRLPVSMLLVKWRVLVGGACMGIERWKGLFLVGACSLVVWLDERLAGRLFKPVGVRLSNNDGENEEGWGVPCRGLDGRRVMRPTRVCHRRGAGDHEGPPIGINLTKWCWSLRRGEGG